MAKATKTMTVKKTLEQRYLDFLGDEGYRPQAAPDTDDLDFRVIAFKSEGSTFLLFVYEDDPISRNSPDAAQPCLSRNCRKVASDMFTRKPQAPTTGGVFASADSRL